MRKVMFFIELMKEVSFIFDIPLPNPVVFCKLSEDNQSFISAAESKTLSPKTKHIAIKYNHFQSFVLKKIIWMCYIDTREKKWKFSLSHLMNHYSSIYKETYLDRNLKSETFSSTQGSIIIQSTTLANNLT